MIVSAIYYLSAPFHLSALVILFWLANTISVVLLLRNHIHLSGELSPALKIYRLVFTITLIASEIIINLISESYQADNFHGFISDNEVLLTGITLGVLWHYELTKRFK